jgi:hypothetical protein
MKDNQNVKYHYQKTEGGQDIYVPSGPIATEYSGTAHVVVRLPDGQEFSSPANQTDRQISEWLRSFGADLGTDVKIVRR